MALPSDHLTTELERLHHGFYAMARSFREFSSTGGKYLGADECADMASYFEGKSVYLAELLAHHAKALGEWVLPPVAAGRPRLVVRDGEVLK